MEKWFNSLGVEDGKCVKGKDDDDDYDDDDDDDNDDDYYNDDNDDYSETASFAIGRFWFRAQYIVGSALETSEFFYTYVYRLIKFGEQLADNFLLKGRAPQAAICRRSSQKRFA